MKTDFAWDFYRNVWWNGTTIILDEDMPLELETPIMERIPRCIALDLAIGLRLSGGPRVE